MLKSEDLEVRGRGKALYAEVHVSRNCATVRVDDAANASFWVQVTLTREQVAEILRRMDSGEEG